MAACDNFDNFEEALREVCDLFSIQELKEEQKTLVKTMLDKKDCMAILPTGYGKSLPYQILLPLARRLSKTDTGSEYPFDSESKIIVCCPLVALMEDQVKRLENIGCLRAVYKGRNKDVDGEILRGDFDILFASPEVLVGDNDFRKQLQKCNVGIIVVDEFHTIYEWQVFCTTHMVIKCRHAILIKESYALSPYIQEKPHFKEKLLFLVDFNLVPFVLNIMPYKTTVSSLHYRGGLATVHENDAFRKWFRYLGELRSLWPQASLLALSATCTKKIKNHVSEVLGLDPAHTTEITRSPNKENIKLIVKKVDRDIESAMYWLIESLGSLRDAFPRTLIYCNSISDVSKLYNYTITEISECAKFVDMYHSETPEENKKLIIEALGTRNSDKRVIICTSALGMGIDVVECNSVILYGPPRNVVDLIQSIGRVGRNGEQSVALIMYNSYQFRNVDQDMNKFILSKYCRRKNLMSNFMSDTDLLNLDKEINVHTCCDMCTDMCKCKKCSLLPLEKLCSNDFSSSGSDTVDYEYDVSDNNFSDNEFYETMEECDVE